MMADEKSEFNPCSNEEIFAPECVNVGEENTMSSRLQGCVEDDRYPYHDIYQALIRYRAGRVFQNQGS
jgi:hypothetical protein